MNSLLTVNLKMYTMPLFVSGIAYISAIRGIGASKINVNSSK